ncbi:U6_snRNA-associated Sm-like protein LSm3 [Hexamita inflata]|uniref:Putative n=1 Tax=Hexamita inflata TaxID=28002 RepID=A0AA86VSL2_9EUKA|nr:U6 snRNA-associated Sm-like protein LSm3 [Hexamita inflata]
MNSSPFDLLQETITDNARLKILLRSNQQIEGELKSYDRHFNLMLVNAIVNGEQKKSYFLRGDNVIFIQKINM